MSNANGSSQNQTSVTMYGNLGDTPAERQTKAREKTIKFFDPVIEEVVEKDIVESPKTFYTYSIASEHKLPDETKATKWFKVIDYNDPPLHKKLLLGKGDRIKVTGRFLKRTYKGNDGAERTELQIIASAVEVVRRKKATEIE